MSVALLPKVSLKLGDDKEVAQRLKLRKIGREHYNNAVYLKVVATSHQLCLHLFVVWQRYDKEKGKSYTGLAHTPPC